MRSILIASLTFFCSTSLCAQYKIDSSRVFNGHTVQLDKSDKLLPRNVGDKNPYDHFLHLRWNFIKTKVPNSPGPEPRSSYPQYFFYCAFIDSAGYLLPDKWMNDVGEKMPMWLESARLYKDYSGDGEPLERAKQLVDYSLEHGITKPDFSWPNFPYTAANAGELEFTGFTGRFAEHDLHVDHAGDLGSAYYKCFLLFGDNKYRKAAIDVADVLASKIQKGSSTHSPWPYMVNAKTGKTVSEYGTNWFGCIRLLSMLIEHKEGNVEAYTKTLETVREWLLQYPFKNGLWVDGHTDTHVSGTTNLSNLSASNAGLYLYDNPGFSDAYKKLLPSLIEWTEKNFVFKGNKDEPFQMWGANIVSEQVAFMPKMDYQTARYAAQCARWYRLSGNEEYRDKAFRALNFVTYCNDSTGKAFESPFTKGVNSWWSDSYGECPIMFYHAFAGMPEWAPANENHVLYSSGIIRNVEYGAQLLSYEAIEKSGSEHLRLDFKPALISIDGQAISPGKYPDSPVYIRSLSEGDYSLVIRRSKNGKVLIKGKQ